MSSNSSIIKDILHYQKKIQKTLGDDNSFEDHKELLRYLGKLAKLPIGVEHLQETGIGRTINAMRKKEGAIGEEARALVNKWKNIVAAEDENDSDAQEEETSANQPDDSDGSSDHKQKSSSKKGKQSKHKEDSPSTCEDTPSTSKTKSSKSSDKHKTEKHKDTKVKEESSKSKSKSSRKRRHSDSASQTDEQDGDEATSRSFADALGSIESVSKKKKSKDKEKHREEKKKKVMSPPPAPTPVLNSVSSLASKPLDIRPTDFEISPYYKPLPLKFTSDSPSALVKEKTRSSEEALSVAMAQKGSRTKVFSGNRVSGLSSVPSLFDSCMRVLQMNIECLEVIGGVPYDLILPVLERTTPHQLYKLEHYNPYLLEDTDELWRRHCEKEFKKYPLEEMESWRDKYLRCVELREAKLKSLTMSHKQSAAKATPVRTTKLAYVESVTKAPRGQTKQGASAVLASMTNARAGARPFEAAHQSANGAAAVAEVVKMAAPSGRSSSSSASSNGASAAAAAKKPKVAPLMQKTLKLMKNRFRR